MLLCNLGHIARANELRAAGFTRSRLDAAIASGAVRRLQRGTFACAHLDGPLVAAGSVGGALTCVSVLREHGVWAGHDHRAHVQVSPHSSARIPLGVRAHRENARFGLQSPWRMSRMQALWQAIRCLDSENAIAAMESAIKKEFLTEAEVRRLGFHAPRRMQPHIRQLVVDSGSGNETITRLRLEEAGYRVEVQGEVPGVGHQDLVVNELVGLEIDSKEWHDDDEQRGIDVDRDLVSEGLGRHVLRIRPSHVHVSWPRTLAVIDRVVADAERLRRKRR